MRDEEYDHVIMKTHDGDANQKGQRSFHVSASVLALLFLLQSCFLRLPNSFRFSVTAAHEAAVSLGGKVGCWWFLLCWA